MFACVIFHVYVFEDSIDFFFALCLFLLLLWPGLPLPTSPNCPQQHNAHHRWCHGFQDHWDRHSCSVNPMTSKFPLQLLLSLFLEEEEAGQVVTRAAVRDIVVVNARHHRHPVSPLPWSYSPNEPALYRQPYNTWSSSSPNNIFLIASLPPLFSRILLYFGHCASMAYDSSDIIPICSFFLYCAVMDMKRSVLVVHWRSVVQLAKA